MCSIVGAQDNPNGVYLIKFKEDVSEESIKNFINTNGLETLQILKYNYVRARVKYFPDQSNITNAAVNQYNTIFENLQLETTLIESVEKSRSFTYYDLPNDPGINESYYLNVPTNINLLWDRWGEVINTEDLVVAIFDSGIDVEHEDLKDNLWTNPNATEIPGDGIDNDNNGYVDDINGVNVTSKNGDLTDYVGHGTFVSGIIGARGNNGIGISGVCQKIKLLMVKLDNDDITQFISAMDYAENAGAKIVNISWGWRSDEKINHLLYEERMKKSNLLFVCAAGNLKTGESESVLAP